MQGQTKVFNYPNATVRVHIPDLAKEEKDKRIKEIKYAAELVIREVLKNEYRSNNTSGNTGNSSASNISRGLV